MLRRKFNPKENRPAFMQGYDQPNQLAKRNCLMCPKELPSWVKYYCSGVCMQQAKDQGIYGHEIKD